MFTYLTSLIYPPYIQHHPTIVVDQKKPMVLGPATCMLQSWFVHKLGYPARPKTGSSSYSPTEMAITGVYMAILFSTQVRTVTTFKYVEGGPDRKAPEVVQNACSYIFKIPICKCSYRIVYSISSWYPQKPAFFMPRFFGPDRLLRFAFLSMMHPTAAVPAVPVPPALPTAMHAMRATMRAAGPGQRRVQPVMLCGKRWQHATRETAGWIGCCWF